MNRWNSLLLAFLLVLAACGNDDNNEKEKRDFFPVLPFLQGQVAHIDSSLYNIKQVNKANGQTDTLYIKREDFKAVANDFLTIPDIASKKLKKKYNESRLYDETLGKVVITYTPKEEDMEIIRQDIIIQPNPELGDQVETIYIERVLSNDDSTVQKKMTWEVEKGFQILSIIQNKNGAETIKNKAVSWTNNRSAE